MHAAVKRDRKEPIPLPSLEEVDVPVPSIHLPLVSPDLNKRLTVFFDATLVRTRLYFLLASLWRHHSIRTANAMAFDLFLAMVPMLGIAGWAAGLVLRGTSRTNPSEIFSSIAPSDLNNFLGRHFEALAASHLAPVAALAGWWLSSSAFNTMICVFEETFDCRPRSYIEARLMSLALALLGMCLLGLAGALGVVVAMAPEAIGLWLESLRGSGIVKAMVGVGAFASMTAFLAVIYRYTIYRPGRKRRVWPGAFIASTLGTIASVGLGFYATNIARYALFYGGLAAIVVVLLWLWLWSTAILIGAEVNVALEEVGVAKEVIRNSVFLTEAPLIDDEFIRTQATSAEEAADSDTPVRNHGRESSDNSP